jgi:hypothetical protein
MNQGTQGYILTNKNQRSKISWDCPFNGTVRATAVYRLFTLWCIVCIIVLWLWRSTIFIFMNLSLFIAGNFSRWLCTRIYLMLFFHYFLYVRNSVWSLRSNKTGTRERRRREGRDFSSELISLIIPKFNHSPIHNKIWPQNNLFFPPKIVVVLKSALKDESLPIMAHFMKKNI